MSTYQFNTLFQVNVMCIHFMYLTVRFRWKADVSYSQRVEPVTDGERGSLVLFVN